eukprot:CAMPEP_0113467018 /NCGR_PEP_ID=MMETSP0014_2-20120614/14589_1 /TAXON_ID=2857 /ORGANISM="Nitzschia sp." /LENGTH=382 /DNA_ID=CAMNT_0000359295 /DNA_START=427 /DNA_END=1575 /DNA_ORIENTATION=+ /assembly_acc=CAM_ASM_000159
MTEFSHLSAGHHPKVFPTESYKPHSQSLFNKTSANPIDKLDKASYKPITSFHKDDIEEELLDPNATHEMSYENAINGREHLVAILSDAGVSMDVEVIASLPKWNDVTQMYGGNDGPVIIGLERCEEYRRKTPVHDAYIGTAGMFNTGTNPFAMYLEKNCEMPHNTKDRTRGMHWQVPWGKHILASMKWNTTGKHAKNVNKTNVLPVVLVRDPYSWMQSMCQNPYNARWEHNKICPHLINRKTHKPNPLRFSGPEIWFDSLAHFWAQYYAEYLDADYPRLLVRFEDIHFHVKELIDRVCQCAGGVARHPEGGFKYILGSAKWGGTHTSKTNMVTAMIKYGSNKNRFKGMSGEDMEFAATVFNARLMNLFQYEMPQHQKEEYRL